MGKFCRHLFTFVFLALLPAIAFSALVPPQFDTVKNYSGPLVFFWNTLNNTVTPSTYVIFISTTYITSPTYAGLLANSNVTQISSQYNGIQNVEQNTVWVNGISNQEYYVMIGVDDGTGNPGGQLLSSNELQVFCLAEKIVIPPGGITSSVSSGNPANDNILYFDTDTIKYTINVRGQFNDPILPPAKVNVDIQTSNGSKSVFVITPQLDVNFNVPLSSFSFSATATFIWDGTVFTDRGNKHNGGYILTATPVDSSNSPNPGGIETYGTFVKVVHINFGAGLVYQVVGKNQPHYGPPFYFNYFLSDAAFSTWKIFNQNGTSNPSDDTLLKVVVSSVARVDGDMSDDPADWNKLVEVESWDGRNSAGLIVPNDIYAYTFDAYDYSTDHAVTVRGTISFDVLRIVDIASTGITDTTPLAHIKYTLAGANSQAGGATVKIIICAPGTNFFMAAAAGSMPYLNGASTYTYVAGDPVPTVAANLKKVFVFARTAGPLDETWNGFDETGTALANNNYVFAISGTDDSGNHAIDNSGNDGIIVGNITIDRTAAQVSTDATPPNVTGISAGGTNMALSGGAVLTQPFATLSVSMVDVGGSGVDLTGSMVTLTGPTTNIISVTTSNNGTDTVILAFSQQSANGTYTVRIRPRDKVGNTASDVIYNFTVNISASGVASAFAQSTFAYPNPVKGVAFATFAYTVNNPATIKLEVYNILGELMYQESWLASQPGAQTKTWNLVNQAGNKLATGVYLYRLSTSAVSTTPKFQKIIIIQ